MTYRNNKLGKHLALLRVAKLARHLPPAKPATKAKVRRMLEKYRAVYLKPINGTGGRGIFKLSRRDNGYRLQYRTRRRSFETFGEAYVAFTKKAGKKKYLVQKGIPLLRYRGRPFDLRIMLQRGPHRKWQVTGMVGRLASPRKIVTNYHSGGTPMQVRKLLAPHLPAVYQASYLKRLKVLSLRITRRMSGIFPRFRAYGVDIGLDKELKPWIIEVNTEPDKYIFNALSDKRMFRKIMRYARLSKR